jgi:hypothetical protein
MSNPSNSKEPGPGLAFAWTKDVLLVLFSLALIWRVVIAKIDLKGFSFNDLLSLLLAVFSVALSVAFYFKANETSNKFYDNTYKFTKEMSELLGRIESGFGERLRHLDEGYSTMAERVDKLPNYFAPTVSQVQSSEDEVATLNQNVAKIIESFASRAHLAEQEKNDIVISLSRANEELAEAKKALSMMKSRADDDANLIKRRRRLPPKSIVLRFVAEEIKKIAPVGLIDGTISENAVVEGFESIKRSLPPEAIDDMKAHGLVDDTVSLTEAGKLGLLNVITS